jgi:hypothetical protein
MYPNRQHVPSIIDFLAFVGACSGASVGICVTRYLP